MKVAQFIGKPLIHKDYRKYIVDGNVLECSVVDPEMNTEFCYGEVEFNNEKDASEFEWPFEGATDVTYDKSYKMKNYWLRTRT